MKFNYPVPSHFQFLGRDGSGTWKNVRDGSGTGIPSDPDCLTHLKQLASWDEWADMVWSLKVESIWGGYWTVAPLIFFYFFIFSGFYFQSSDQNQTWPNSKRYTRWWSRSHSHSGHLRHPCPALASIHPDTHLRIARACWMVTSLFCDSFGQICTYGPKVGHSYMKTNIKLRLIDQNLWEAMKLPWKNMKTN